MRLVDAYPVVVTDRLLECRDFYCRWFGFEVAFEADWFVWLRNDAERPVALAFMHSAHPSSPPSPEPYRARGASSRSRSATRGPSTNGSSRADSSLPSS